MSRQPFFLLFVVLTATLLVACSADPDPVSGEAPPLVDSSGKLDIEIVIPIASEVGLSGAAVDLAEALQRISDGALPAAIVKGGLNDATRTNVVFVEVSENFASELGEQGFSIYSGVFNTTRKGLRVRARTQIGAMYGLYRIAADLGVRYHHPEETFFPRLPQATLPWSYEDTIDTPRFLQRGFHEHTQHPTVMSDFLLRPSAEFRPYVSRYIRWFARNRQNAMSWHMLKTVELSTWLPYISDVVAEAHDYGIDVGMVLSFVDEQQNNFKIVDEGSGVDPLVQIRTTLDQLADAGFDFFTFQIGSSEFTKPDEAAMISWLNLGTSHMAARARPVKTYAWIHTTCSLDAEDGSYYYHLPKHADPDLGAWVHTTMFYTLDLPAPVYDCEDFTHNLDFLEAEHDKREQVYFPESAWWLGFDNNMPLALPVTGWSRGHDIQNVLAPYNVRGHITFTTGREWNYWHYDHYLMAATWDDELSWSGYLDWIAPMYGAHGELYADVLDGWTQLQARHFYEENPLIFFYLAGELRQDEIGEQAGIAARRPKIAYRDVVAMDNATFNAWHERDFKMLERMRTEYAELFDRLPASEGHGSTLQERLYHEAYNTLAIYMLRIDHSLALYASVIKVREFVRLRRQAGEEGVEAGVRQALLDDALALHAAASAISARVIVMVADVEALYRYPLELLAREKPETLTIYPFGYLWETSTGHFWTRRDEQLGALIAIDFETIPEEWINTPERLFASKKAETQILKPDDALARSVLASFIPQMLFGLNGFESEAPDVLVLAQDYNENLKPDLGTEASINGTRDGATWSGRINSYALVVHDSAGFIVGELTLLDALIELTLTDEPLGLTSAELHAQISGQALVQMVVNVGGIDTAGATVLVKAVFGIPRADPLPARLDVAFGFAF
ncbi:MAG: hypothetical protein H0U74_20730 [Bradymonadaceae bacterium]|nr:hypothetical protein [Lujinxingiaceae bacterium]